MSVLLLLQHYNNVTLQYLDPPVAGGAVINPHCAVGQGVAEPAAVHVAQGRDRLNGGEHDAGS